MLRAIALRRATLIATAPHALSATAAAAARPCAAVVSRLFSTQPHPTQRHQPQRSTPPNNLHKRIYLAPHERLAAEAVIVPPPPPPKRSKKKQKRHGAGLHQQQQPPPPPPASPIPVQYLSFFQYAALPRDSLESLRSQFFAQLQEMGCRGRIYLSVEGINAQMTAPLAAMEKLRETVDQLAGGVFRGVEFTMGEIQIQEPTTPQQHHHAGARLGQVQQQQQQPQQQKKGVSAFRALHVRIRQRLVNDGLTPAEHAALNLADHGEQLSPAEWHAQLSANPNATLFDVRNFYESEIGHFQGAVPLDTQTYLESFRKIDALLNERDQRDGSDAAPSKTAPTYMYCTGGIRCIKVGAYLRSKGHTNIKLLRGGINAYANFIRDAQQKQTATAASTPDAVASATPDATAAATVPAASIPAAPVSIFKGKNFVFDSRMESGAPESSRLTADVISSCAFCGAPHDTHSNCRNSRCHALFLQCGTCAERMDHTCSDACKHVVRSIADHTLLSYAEVPRPADYQFRPRVTWEETKKARAKQAETGSTAAAAPAGITPTTIAAAAGAPGMQSAKFSTLSRHAPRSEPRFSLHRRGFASQAARADLMAVPLDPAIAAYCVAHSTPADSAALLQSIADRTDASMPDRSQMLSDPLVGLLLRCLARASLSGVAAPRFLEIGAFTGYSAAWLMETMHALHDSLAAGASDGSSRPSLLSLEVSEEYAALCRANLQQHPCFEQFTLVTGPALESLQAIVQQRADAAATESDPPSSAASPSLTGAFDLIFLDANKKQYPAYVDLILGAGLLKPNGLLVIDNTLWKGRVLMDDNSAAAASPGQPDSMTRCMHSLNRTLPSNPALLVTMLPIRDGVTIVQWRQAARSP